MRPVRRTAAGAAIGVALAVLPSIPALSPAAVLPPAGAATPTTAKPAGAAAVRVTFDTPGSTPRPLKETVQAIGAPTRRLAMDIRSITYAGITCGFTFRGTRPPTPVTIRVRGKAKAGAFDSGELKVAWLTGADPKVDAGASTDPKGGWSFSAEAHANRNGPGWVVSVGGVPLQKDKAGKPTSASCTITAAPTASFVPANGPVGYWAGFATV